MRNHPDFSFPIFNLKMKLSNKTFFIFLAVLFACGCLMPLIFIVIILTFDYYWICQIAAFFIIFKFFPTIAYLIGGLCTLCVYKGNQWYKLAGYMLLFTSLIVFIGALAISIASCERPKDILFIPLCTLGIWVVTSILPTILVAYITKSLIDKYKDKMKKGV